MCAGTTGHLTAKKKKDESRHLDKEKDESFTHTQK